MTQKKWRKILGLILAGAMTIQTPAAAFASDVEFTDAEYVDVDGEAADAETENADVYDVEAEDMEESSEESELAEADLFTDGQEGTQEYVEENVSEEVETSDVLDAADEEAKAAAAKYIQDTFITGTTKIITNGLDGVVKSADGLSYTLGLTYTSSSGNVSNLSSFSMYYVNTEAYKSGWYMDKNCEWVTNYANKKPRNPRNLAIKRPTADQGDQSFTMTLRIFSADTSDGVINGENAADSALASQDFTITIAAAEREYYMTVGVQDAAGTAIEGATVTLKDGNTPINPQTSGDHEGKYSVVKGKEYTLTVTKDGYAEYSNTFTFEGGDASDVTKTVTLQPIVYNKVSFNVKDKSGAAIENPTIVVRKGTSTWGKTVSRAEDGTYQLEQGQQYNYTVSADGYTSDTWYFVPKKDTEIAVVLAKDISQYKVAFKAMDGDKEVSGAAFTVTYEEIDYWSDETETVTVTPNTDGTYTLEKGEKYTCTVKAEGYKDATEVYTPSGENEAITRQIKLKKAGTEVSEADQAKVDAIKAKFNGETLRPTYKKYKNINELVLDKIKTYEGLDTEGVTVSVSYSEDESFVAADGTIHYNTEKLNTSGNYVKNLDLMFTFEAGNAAATADARATIGWDQDYYNSMMQAEADSLTWDDIKGENTDASDVETDLELPGRVVSNARLAWSTITWESSRPRVLNIEQSGYYNYKGTVNPLKEDTEVTLTATFKANDVGLNSYVESVDDFAAYTKTFTVTVKGSGVAPSEEELQAILDKYYTTDRITDFVTKETADLANCQGDLQLPRYTRITDSDNTLVFENKEITVTSENPAITISGYRAVVDPFYSTTDTTGDLVVTFTREGVSVTKRISVTVKPISEEKLDAELAMMEQAKLHYFDGINDGLYTDKDSVTGNLHAFKEMTLNEDGNPVWVYKSDEATGTGITPDDFPGYDSMSMIGYRTFKSSDNAVVTHENLLVTQQDTDTEVTISSVLSSERYGKFAESHPENEKLQKLYKQPVSVTITVVGTKAPKEGLQGLIDSTQELLDAMAEGDKPGEYPAGTKDTLKKALEDAAAVCENEASADTDLRNAIRELKKAVEAAKEAQNVVTANVTVRINQNAGQPAQLQTLTVTAKDAAAYGYEKPEDMTDQVTVADALYTLHKAMYGDDFAANPKNYLVIGSGKISKIFGIETYAIGYKVNNKTPMTADGVYTDADTSVLNSGDELEIFLYADTSNWSDMYLYFENVPKQVEAGQEFSVTVMSNGWTGAAKEKDCKVVLKNTETGETVEAISDAEGKVTLKADKAGKYQLYITETPYTYAVVPMAEIEVKAAEPTSTPTPTPTVAPTKTTTATTQVLLAKAQAKSTSVTVSWNNIKGATKYRIYGTKCGSGYKLLKTVSSKTTKWTQKKLKKGTSYKYYVAAYDKNGRIVKSDTIHTNTTGGKYGNVKAIKVNKTKVTLKAGKKLTLKTSLITTGKKLHGHVNSARFVSSNKAVATVSKAGKITAVKKGTCYVYCYAQNGVYKKVKVTVK